MTSIPTIEYRLGKIPLLGREEGVYPQLEAVNPEKAIVKTLEMYAVGDRILFGRNDGNPSYGMLDLHLLGQFEELPGHNRLRDLADSYLTQVAERMHELCYPNMHGGRERQWYARKKIDVSKDAGYQQMVQELRILQQTQRHLIDSGELVLPPHFMVQSDRDGYLSISFPQGLILESS